MNSKRVFKLTAVFLTVLFSFILFSPTINALDYDPNSIWNQHHPGTFTPTGDDDPFGVDKSPQRPSIIDIINNWQSFIIVRIVDRYRLIEDIERNEPESIVGRNPCGFDMKKL